MTEPHVDVVVESIDALRSVLAYQQQLPSNWLSWFQSSCVVLTGVGKSFDVARLGASLLQSVGLPAQAIHATDLLHGGFGVLPAGASSTLVALSHSGRTREVLDVKTHVRQLRGYGRIIRTVAITSSNAGNTLATLVQHTLRYDCVADGSRHGTIPSVSTTAQLAWLNAIACAEASLLPATELALSHPGGNLATVYERLPSE